jgi:hypothetical protein
MVREWYVGFSSIGQPTIPSARSVERLADPASAAGISTLAVPQPSSRTLARLTAEIDIAGQPPPNHETARDENVLRIYILYPA